MEANIAVLTLRWFEVKPIKRYKCNLTKRHLKLYQKYNDIIEEKCDKHEFLSIIVGKRGLFPLF